MNRAQLRIIDANFNRAREGLRVMEDFCRFCLESAALSSRCKQIRHELSNAISRLGNEKLLACRDTEQDVGTTIRVEHQLSRMGLADAATAAAKRLTEALRTISETAQGSEPGLAADVERLRYRSYTLEKEIFLAANVRQRFASVRLYVLLSCCEHDEIIRLARECAAGGADCMQLRCKELSDRELLATAAEFVKICQEHGVISIINDRVDIAIASGADGMHLGQDDLGATVARGIMPRPMIIGASTHNPEELASAISDDYDYAGIGPAFESLTKPGLKTAGLEYIRYATKACNKAGIASVAIGGITLENAGQVIEAGARAIAVGAEICNAREPQKVCRQFKDFFAKQT